MPDVRYLRTMISGVPVVTAPDDIDVTSAGQLTCLDRLVPCFSGLDEVLTRPPAAAGTVAALAGLSCRSAEPGSR